MSISNTSNDASLRLGVTTLPCIGEMKDLGFNKITFTTQIIHIVSQASVRANLIKKCFVSGDVSTLIRAYVVYVMPLLEYATCVWSPSYAEAIQLI